MISVQPSLSVRKPPVKKVLETKEEVVTVKKICCHFRVYCTEVCHWGHSHRFALSQISNQVSFKSYEGSSETKKMLTLLLKLIFTCHMHSPDTLLGAPCLAASELS